MADEKPTEDQAAQPETDWKAEFERVTAELEEARRQSRKWEERSKGNADKAKRYDELAAQSMTDAERIDAETKRADAAANSLAETASDKAGQINRRKSRISEPPSKKTKYSTH